MTKKKIRYSELAPASPQAPAPVTPAPETPAPTAAAPETVADPVQPRAPRVRRNSSPVELAHALAAARAAESAATALAEADRSATAPVRRVIEAPVSVTTEMLMFRVANEHFAVDLLSVEEVIDLPVIHHVPEMPPAMLGVVAVRGSLTPVYSPQMALGLPLAERAAVLIFAHRAGRVGVLIDDVDDALALDLRELRARSVTTGGDNVVLGVVRHEEMLVAIVDVDLLIATCQQAALQETA